MADTPKLHSGPCRDCGIEIETSLRTARATRRCTACYNAYRRNRLATEARRRPDRHDSSFTEAETLDDLRRWARRREEQRARDIAEIESITAAVRPVRRRP